MASAPRPNLISSQFASLNTPTPEELEKNPAEFDAEEMSLNVLALSDGWRILEVYINTLESQLDQSVSQAMSAGAAFEDIGQRSAVAMVTKAYLEKVKAKVTDAKEAIQKENGVPQQQ